MNGVNAAQSLAVTALLFGCSAPAPNAASERFTIQVAAVSDDGDALSGAAVRAGGQSVGATGPAGRLSVSVQGREGQSVELAVACPAGYDSPEKPVTVRLTHARRLNADAVEATECAVSCVRRKRDVVLVVRAAEGPSLPILNEGRVVGQTDLEGYATIHMSLERDVRQVTFELDTTSRRNLRPQNPSKVFALTGKDAILLMDQRFVVPRAFTPRGHAPARHVPYKVE